MIILHAHVADNQQHGPLYAQNAAGDFKTASKIVEYIWDGRGGDLLRTRSLQLRTCP